MNSLTRHVRRSYSSACALFSIFTFRKLYHILRSTRQPDHPTIPSGRSGTTYMAHCILSIIAHESLKNKPHIHRLWTYVKYHNKMLPGTTITPITKCYENKLQDDGEITVLTFRGTFTCLLHLAIQASQREQPSEAPREIKVDRGVNLHTTAHNTDRRITQSRA